MLKKLKKVLYYVPLLGLILQEFSMFLTKEIVSLPTTKFGYQVSAFWHLFWFFVILVEALS